MNRYGRPGSCRTNNLTNIVISSSDVVKDLRFEDKDLKSEDKDKEL